MISSRIERVSAHSIDNNQSEGTVLNSISIADSDYIDVFQNKKKTPKRLFLCRSREN
jgi:hypothetical protein